MALSHYKNSHAAVNKWEPVNQSLFEVTILPPALDGQQDDLTTTLLLEHVRSIGGLDDINPSVGLIVQKFKFAERHYAGGPEKTSVTLSVNFSLNLNDANENYIYTTLRKWTNRIYNPANGALGLKKQYCGSMVIVEYNRDGSIWRKLTCTDLFPTGQVTGMGEKNYDNVNDAAQLTATFICDVWDDATVGLPVYE